MCSHEFAHSFVFGLHDIITLRRIRHCCPYLDAIVFTPLRKLRLEFSAVVAQDVGGKHGQIHCAHLRLHFAHPTEAREDVDAVQNPVETIVALFES